MGIGQETETGRRPPNVWRVWGWERRSLVKQKGPGFGEGVRVR